MTNVCSCPTTVLYPTVINSMSGSRDVGYVEEDFDFRFQFPFSAVIAGPSGSGKTIFVKNLLCKADKLIDVKIDNIVFLYGCWQPLYDELLSLFDIKFIEGIPKYLTDENLSTLKLKRRSAFVSDQGCFQIIRWCTCRKEHGKLW